MKFLIGQLARYGDCLYATAIAKQIKNDFPDSHITWAVADNYKSILELNPYIDSIWEIPITDGDYYEAGWKNFEKEALQRKANGEFDEIIFSQIHPLNWKNFDGTIRGAILNSYQKPITVSVEPTIYLSKIEVENVRNFAEKNNLTQFENVILFECAPGSEQSSVNPQFALNVANEVVKQNGSVCLLLSAADNFESNSDQIIDASVLTFRENAELTKYCNLLIGCSSGITWLSTSDWAKKLPMLQLLNADLKIYAGIHYDFEINNLDYSRVVEMVDFDEQKTVDCVNSILKNGIEQTKQNFHQIYKPNFKHAEAICNGLLQPNISWHELKKFIENFGDNRNRKLPLRYWKLLVYTYFYYKLKNIKKRFFS